MYRSINYDFYPGLISNYNITVVTSTVPGENVTVDNSVQKMVFASPQVIFPRNGDILSYIDVNMNSSINQPYPYDFKYVVVDTSNPLAVQIDLYSYVTFNNIEMFVQSFYLNTYTREFSDIWELFPYWINPNVQIGQTFDLFSHNDHSGVVIGEDNLSYYGVNVPVWIVNDSSELLYYTKADGILIDIRDFNFNPYLFTMVSTNVLPVNLSLYNYRGSLVTPILGSPNAPTNITMFVQNTGEFNDTADIYLLVNGNITFYTTVSGGTGAYFYISSTFTPPNLGDYYIELYVFSYNNDTYIDDNYDNYTLNVINLTNYDVSYPAFQWYDAVNNGFNLGFYGDDAYTSLQLPFSFGFYDTSFNTIYISSNGWFSFTDRTRSSPSSQPGNQKQALFPCCGHFALDSSGCHRRPHLALYV